MTVTTLIQYSIIRSARLQLEWSERLCFAGFLNYDRSNKFSAAGTAAIKQANQAIIAASSSRSQGTP